MLPLSHECAVTAPKTTVRRVRADERAAWEPLWKGYQAAHSGHSLAISLAES